MIDFLAGIGVVPVVSIDDVDKAVPLAHALRDGGIPCVEITLRTEAGVEAIRRIATELPDIMVGAGTVLTIEQAKQAVNAGARFIVAPGFNEMVVRYCIERGAVVIPGCATPTDVECALGLGLTAIKLFPAEQLGGADYLKALSGPYGAVRFMPTGGVNESNLYSYLDCKNVFACGGSWMVKPEYIREKQYERITALCKDTIRQVVDFKLAHIGINAADSDEAHKVAAAVSALFGFSVRETSISVFSGNGVEVMSGSGKGEKGHIGFSTRDMERAAAYFDRLGILYDRGAMIKGANGKYPAVYLDVQIAGFAVHFMQG